MNAFRRLMPTARLLLRADPTYRVASWAARKLSTEAGKSGAAKEALKPAAEAAASTAKATSEAAAKDSKGWWSSAEFWGGLGALAG